MTNYTIPEVEQLYADFDKTDILDSDYIKLFTKIRIQNKNQSFSNDELQSMIEHLENIQLSASKLGSRYVLLDKFIFTLLENIHYSK